MASWGIDFDAYRIRVFPYRKNRIRLFPYESVPYTAFPVSLLSPYGYGVAVYAYEGVYTGFTLHHLCFFFFFYIVSSCTLKQNNYIFGLLRANKEHDQSEHRLLLNVVVREGMPILEVSSAKDVLPVEKNAV